MGIITKRQSQTVAIRARDLKLEFVYQGQAHKLHAAEEIVAKAGILMEQMAYVGDDIVDLPVMRVCGLAVATANARPQVKAMPTTRLNTPVARAPAATPSISFSKRRGPWTESSSSIWTPRTPLPRAPT